MPVQTMRREVVFRRVAHLLIALAPLYYALPVELPILSVHRWTLVVVFFLGICAFEAYRLKKGMTFLGLRPHERGQIASFAWAAAGIAAVLWLCPHDVAAAALVGMACVDPLAGELRKAKGDSVAVVSSLAAYFVLAFSVLFLWEWRDGLLVVILAAVGSITAVGAERTKVRYVDDDFLMLVVPGAAMTLLTLI
ncbi:MAG: hypothetical protein MUC90_00145 [Thermoplasmata archaeon]|nr:hypothetical protein [Thermoplasmata archaeon]